MKNILLLLIILTSSNNNLFSNSVVSSSNNSNLGLYALSIGICMAFSILGGAIGQGITAYSALEGIARNPGVSSKIFVPMILCLALIESLVLFGLLISFMILGKM